MSSGCGCKEVYTPLQQHPYLFIFLNVFVLVQVHFCNLLNNFFTQIYGRLRGG